MGCVKMKKAGILVSPAFLSEMKFPKHMEVK